MSLSYLCNLSNVNKDQRFAFISGKKFQSWVSIWFLVSVSRYKVSGFLGEFDDCNEMFQQGS